MGGGTRPYTGSAATVTKEEGGGLNSRADRREDDGRSAAEGGVG